jgi:hypothetical protein
MANFSIECMEERDAMAAGFIAAANPVPPATREHILLARQVGVPAVQPNSPFNQFFSPDGKDPSALTVKMSDILITS